MGFLFAKNSTVSNTQNKVGALRVQSSTPGLPVQLVFGTNRVSPNITWYGDFTAIPHTETTQSGGKGGGGVELSNTTYTYTVAVALGLGEGAYVGAEDSQLLRVWAGKEVTTAAQLGLSFFNGGLGQAPWGYLLTNHPAEALVYPFYAYVAAEAYPLGGSDSLPNFSFEVRGIPLPAGPAYSFCTPDANPGLVLQELLTNTRYGIGLDFAGALVDVSEFVTYCFASNFLCSPVYSVQRSAADILEELALIGNSAIVWSYDMPSSDSFGVKVVPYGDLEVTRLPPLAGNGPTCDLGSPVTFTPDLTVQYALTTDDFIAAPGAPPVRVRRKRKTDTYNSVQIECLDRSNGYNSYLAEAKDLLDIRTYGLRAKEVVSLHAICEPQIGRALAQVMLQRNLYIRNEYEFSLGWRYGRLEPMDIVSLTEPELGLSAQLVRIKDITENSDGVLAVTAEELVIGVSTPATYAVQGSQGYQVNNNVDPGQTNDPVVFQPPVELSGVPQIWIGASGGSNWGGAEVWVSDDDTSYSMAGTVTNPARYGVLTSNFPAHGDPDTVNTLSVDLSESGGSLSAATVAQADAGDTLTYVGGELVAYTAATLTAPFTYDLDGYIRRGTRCTVPLDHPVGTKFMRLDSSVLRVNISESRVGSTVYLKLLSFNKTGGARYTLDQVTSMPYVVQPVGVVVNGGSVPSTVTAAQALCVPPNDQYLVQGRMTCNGRINCDGRLIVAA